MTIINSTTTPPRSATSADEHLLAFTQSIELTARDLYHGALETGLDGVHIASIVAIAAHHDAYAQTISSLLGKTAPLMRDEVLFTSLKSTFTSDMTSTALAAHALENTLLVTHTKTLGELQGTDAAALIASILIAQARHVVALAAIAGLSPVDDIDAYLSTPNLAPLSPPSQA